MLHPISEPCWCRVITITNSAHRATAKMCDMLQFLQVQGQMWAPALCTGMSPTTTHKNNVSCHAVKVHYLNVSSIVFTAFALHCCPLYFLTLHYACYTIVFYYQGPSASTHLDGEHYSCYHKYTALCLSFCLRRFVSVGLLLPLQVVRAAYKAPSGSHAYAW